MLKLNNKLAFAIRTNVSDESSIEYTKFFKLMYKLSERIPGFVAEGIGNTGRQPQVDVSIETSICPCGITFDVSHEVKERIICVGLSDKYDVSKENIDDVTFNFTFGRIGKVPIYDLKKDFNTVLDKFKTYMLETHGEKEQQPNIVYHSQFMRIGNRIIRYSDVAGVAEVKRQQERSLNDVIALLRALV